MVSPHFLSGRLILSINLPPISSVVDRQLTNAHTSLIFSLMASSKDGALKKKAALDAVGLVLLSVHCD